MMAKNVEKPTHVMLPIESLADIRWALVSTPIEI